MDETVSKLKFACGVIEAVFFTSAFVACTVQAFIINADAAGYMVGAVIALAFLVLFLVALARAKVRS